LDNTHAARYVVVTVFDLACRDHWVGLG